MYASFFFSRYIRTHLTFALTTNTINEIIGRKPLVVKASSQSQLDTLRLRNNTVRLSLSLSLMYIYICICMCVLYLSLTYALINSLILTHHSTHKHNRCDLHCRLTQEVVLCLPARCRTTTLQPTDSLPRLKTS